MSRSTKIAAVSALAGVMITVATVAVLSAPPAPPKPVAALRGKAIDQLEGELDRCRVTAESDAACEAVWEAHRRRFFADENVPAADPVMKTTDPAPPNDESRP